MNRKILFAGILLYILISPFFYHSDIKEIYFKSHFLSQGIFNVYSYITGNPDAQLFGAFNYQPLTYYFFGVSFMFVRMLAGSGFLGWLAMGNDAVDVPGILRYLFLMKLPLVIAFTLTGYYLSKLYKTSKKKNLALILWFFNPISIYVVGMIGQFDVLPVLLTVMALYYAKRKPVIASILLGLGAAMKGFPFLLIPFLVILIEGTLIRKLKVLLAGVGAFFITILPFITDRAYFEGAALSGLSQRMFIPGISFGFDEKFMIIPGLYLVLIYLAINYDQGRIEKLYQYFFASMFLVASAVHFHAQWALWYLPFLIMVVLVKDRIKNSLYIATGLLLVVCFFVTIFLFNDRFLTFGILSIFDPAVLFLPSPFEIVRRFYDPTILQSIFHTFYLVSGLVIVSKIFHEKISK